MSFRFSQMRTNSIRTKPTLLGGSGFVGAYRGLAMSRDRVMIPYVRSPARDLQAVERASARSTSESTPGTCGYIRQKVVTLEQSESVDYSGPTVEGES